MSRSQFQSKKFLYLDMHGLIYETSVWLLAESTRLLSFSLKRQWRRQRTKSGTLPTPEPSNTLTKIYWSELEPFKSWFSRILFFLPPARLKSGGEQDAKRFVVRGQPEQTRTLQDTERRPAPTLGRGATARFGHQQALTHDTRPSCMRFRAPCLDGSSSIADSMFTATQSEAKNPASHNHCDQPKLWRTVIICA